jgi:hypothetical protein
MSHIGSKEMEYEIGCQGILGKHEKPTVKLYASEFFTAKMCNIEQGMMGESGDQSVYHRTPKARGTIFSPPAREPMIEKVVKYGMRKSSVGVVIYKHQYKCEPMSLPTCAPRHFQKK